MRRSACRKRNSVRISRIIWAFLPRNVIDMYGMVEGNGWMVQCPEGHHLHVPMNYIHPMVLDDNFDPVGYGEYGRFAFLDGSIYKATGFHL